MNKKSLMSRFIIDEEKKEIIFKGNEAANFFLRSRNMRVSPFFLSSSHENGRRHKTPDECLIEKKCSRNRLLDQVNLHILIFDRNNNAYWSATYESVKIQPDTLEFKYGHGYTNYKASKKNIFCDLLFLADPHDDSLIWNLRVRNNSEENAEIEIFAFVEFEKMLLPEYNSGLVNEADQIHVYFDQSLKCFIFKNAIKINSYLEENSLIYFTSDNTFHGISMNRNEFLEENESPVYHYGIGFNDIMNLSLLDDNLFGTLRTRICLRPGEERSGSFFSGAGNSHNEIAKLVLKGRISGFLEKTFHQILVNRDKYLSSFQCVLPDKDAMNFINILEPILMYGGRHFIDNLNVRDSNGFPNFQFNIAYPEILSQIPLNIEKSRDVIRFFLKCQNSNGCFFLSDDSDHLCCTNFNDHFWLVIAVWNLVMEEGAVDFLVEEISYRDDGSASVYNHLRKIITFALNRICGKSNPPNPDNINDQMINISVESESMRLWISLQLGEALLKMQELAKLAERKEDIPIFRVLYKIHKEKMNSFGWDGEWFKKTQLKNDFLLEMKEEIESQICLNAQSLAIMSGYTNKNQGIRDMDALNEKLDKRHSKMLPQSVLSHSDDYDDLLIENTDITKNDSGHKRFANPFLLIAECMLGRGDIAWKYFKEMLSLHTNDITRLGGETDEPYLHFSNINEQGVDNLCLDNTSWLNSQTSGLYSATTQYILGIRPVWEGMLIDPCLPSNWREVKVWRNFRGCTMAINIVKQKGICSGVQQVIVNGKKQNGNVIPTSYCKERFLSILVIM